MEFKQCYNTAVWLIRDGSNIIRGYGVIPIAICLNGTWLFSSEYSGQRWDSDRDFCIKYYNISNSTVVENGELEAIFGTLRIALTNLIGG